MDTKARTNPIAATCHWYSSKVKANDEPSPNIPKIVATQLAQVAVENIPDSTLEKEVTTPVATVLTVPDFEFNSDFI